MRSTGTVKNWQIQKGYGFIRADEGQDIFFHIKDIMQVNQVPKAGERVSYLVHKDGSGRIKAVKVKLEDRPVSETAASKYQSPSSKKTTVRAASHKGKTSKPFLSQRKLTLSLMVLLLAISLVWLLPSMNARSISSDLIPVASDSVDEGSEALAEAFKQHRSNLQVKGAGRIQRILPDDLDGSRHQKFILKLSSGQTVLVAHNIDLAPRITGLSLGDRVLFYGEYEWNSKGGVIHWTHRDPKGRHIGGWLEHEGKRYQ